MFKIQQISEYPLQKKTLNLPDGSQVSFEFYFIPMQRSWFIREMVYEEFVARNIKIVTNPNILRQFKNIIPFGLACVSTENRDPMFPEDFLSEKNVMYLLSSDELDVVEDYFSGG